MANPRLAVTRHVRSGLIAIRDGDRPQSAISFTAWAANSLQFYYDLSVSPVTYDFVTHLAAAEIERRLRGLDSINVIFVPGPLNGIRRELPDYDAVIDSASRVWRLHNLLIPILRFLPSVNGYAVCGSRDQARALIASDPANLYPSDYRVFLPRQPSNRVVHDYARAGVGIWPMLKASERGCRFVSAFLNRIGGRRPIVITLRNYGYHPQRNSRISDWIAFADSLDPTIYAPIFVCDTETAMEQSHADLSRHVVCEAASWNLEIRMALYEAAWLNMGVMHGPLELCWYNENARYLVFLMVGASAVSTVDALEENGYRVGSDLSFAKPWQRIAWEQDKIDSLQAHFAKMCSVLENGTCAEERQRTV